MSLRAELWAWEAPAEVGREELLVLLVLAHAHNDETDRCFPSLPYIARKARMHRVTVYRCLERLEHLGLIIRKTGGGRRANEYRLFGVPRPKYPAERLGEAAFDYPHPLQAATGAVAPGATGERLEGLHSATGAVAPGATGAVAPGATPTGIEQESTRPRSAVADDRPEGWSLLSDDERSSGMAHLNELRQQIDRTRDERAGALEWAGS